MKSSIRKVLSTLIPTLVESRKSQFNRQIKVYKLLGTYRMVVDNLTQSGGLVRTLWKKALVVHAKPKPEVNNVLVLGLGAGSIISITKKFWPKTRITGIEIDPVMINLGEKYFKMDKEKNTSIVIADVFDWLPKNKEKFDLILIDLYIGKNTPTGSETIGFLSFVKKALTPNGSAYFNRLILKNAKSNHKDFTEKLKTTFNDLRVIKTPANLILSVKK